MVKTRAKFIFPVDGMSRIELNISYFDYIGGAGPKYSTESTFTFLSQLDTRTKVTMDY